MTLPFSAQPETDLPFVLTPWEVRTEERVVGHRVKVGISVFSSISNLLAGIVSTHLANWGSYRLPCEGAGIMARNSTRHCT